MKFIDDIIEKIKEFFHPSIKFEVVDTLPYKEQASRNTIYFLKIDDGSEEPNNEYEEYVFVDGRFEKLGSEEVMVHAEGITDEQIKELWK